LTVFGFSHRRSGAWPLPPLQTTIHRRRPSGRCVRGSAGARSTPRASNRRRCTRFSVRRVTAVQRRLDARVYRRARVRVCVRGGYALYRHAYVYRVSEMRVRDTRQGVAKGALKSEPTCVWSKTGLQ